VCTQHLNRNSIQPTAIPSEKPDIKDEYILKEPAIRLCIRRCHIRYEVRGRFGQQYNVIVHYLDFETQYSKIVVNVRYNQVASCCLCSRWVVLESTYLGSFKVADRSSICGDISRKGSYWPMRFTDIPNIRYDGMDAKSIRVFNWAGGMYPVVFVFKSTWEDHVTLLYCGTTTSETFLYESLIFSPATCAHERQPCCTMSHC
jgi:hypothetical protein